MIFAILAQKTRDIGTGRDDAQMIGARKIECSSRKFPGDSLPFDSCGHFRVIKHKAVRESPIHEERTKAIPSSFEAMGRFVVGDSDGVQV